MTKEKYVGRKRCGESTELFVEKLINTNETLKKALALLTSLAKTIKA